MICRQLLKRRFNIVVLPSPSDFETEVEIVRKRVSEIASNYEWRGVPEEEAVRKVVTIFRELRNGMTLDGKEKLKPPSGVISTAEAISLLITVWRLQAALAVDKLQRKILQQACRAPL